MTDSPDVLLQKKVFIILSADAAIKSLLRAAIFDKVPADVAAAFQQGEGITYLTIGAGSSKPELADSRDDEEDGFELDEHILHFDVFSQKIGMLEAKNIVQAVSNALTGAYDAGSFTIAGWTISLCDPHGKLFERGPDMVTTHGALQMRLLISPAG